jgi:hypothetical protein
MSGNFMSVLKDVIPQVILTQENVCECGFDSQLLQNCGYFLMSFWCACANSHDYFEAETCEGLHERHGF